MKYLYLQLGCINNKETDEIDFTKTRYSRRISKHFVYDTLFCYTFYFYSTYARFSLLRHYSCLVEMDRLPFSYRFVFCRIPFCKNYLKKLDANSIMGKLDSTFCGNFKRKNVANSSTRSSYLRSSIIISNSSFVQQKILPMQKR